MIINTLKYHVDNLTNTLISIPWGIELTWAMITPKQASKSIVQKIALGSIYSNPNSKKKRLLLDHEPLWTTMKFITYWTQNIKKDCILSLPVIPINQNWSQFWTAVLTTLIFEFMKKLNYLFSAKVKFCICYIPLWK